MEHENFFADDITVAQQKIDDVGKLKATKNFLEGERDNIDLMMEERQEEKFDAEKSKEDVDDFLTFHDDIGDSQEQQPSPTLLPPSTTTFTAPADDELISSSRITPTTFADEFHDNRESDDDEQVEEAYENIVKQTQPSVEQFHAIEDEFLSPYPAGASKVDEKFISSEDLLADFKDPHPVEDEDEPEAEVEVVEEPPVVVAAAAEPIQHARSSPSPPPPAPVSAVEEVVEPVKPMKAATVPPVVLVAAPVKKQTLDDTQIEAEKIFKSIGLGELASVLCLYIQKSISISLKYPIELSVSHFCAKQNRISLVCSRWCFLSFDVCKRRNSISKDGKELPRSIRNARHVGTVYIGFCIFCVICLFCVVENLPTHIMCSHSRLPRDGDVRPSLRVSGILALPAHASLHGFGYC